MIDRTDEAELRRRFALGDDRVFVYPAMTAPHKRHDFLVELMQRHWTDPDLRLVLIGGQGLAEDDVARAIDRSPTEVRQRIVRLGRVSDADRNGLLAMAEAMVFPSEYEGFGAPLIEAMALGTPVICSDATCLPEVVGDAAVVRPLQLDAWADALDEVAARRVAAGGCRPRACPALHDPGVRTRPARGLSTGAGRVTTAPSGGALPALRSRHRAHRRRHDPHRHRARRARARTARRHLAALVPRAPHRGRVERAVGAARADRLGLDHPRATRSPATTSATWSGGLSGSPASRSSARVASWRGGRVDGVIAMSPPLTLGLTGWTTHLIRRGPLVFNIQDVFPDAAVETGAITDRRIIAVAEWLERVSYRRAAAVTVLSDDLRDNVAAKLPPGRRDRVHVIPNFVDTAFIRPADRMTPYRAEHGIGDEPVVMYAGNVGFSQSLELLLGGGRRVARRDVRDQR